MSTNEKLAPGMVLGRYELLLPIAQGGMATVWAARQKGSRGFQKTVAIKTMLPTLSDDAQFEQMFLDEASLAARIHHPHVAEILDLGEQDEVLYLVMEWIDGEALSVIHKAVRKNDAQLPTRVALRVAIQAAAGLHAAHELRDENDVILQLVHRDVSPQNILVTYDGVVKLVDFGVAKAVNRAGGETTAGQLKGKVPYMSPEQARGDQVDRRTDIFALGIVLYKLTTGLHPFLGDNDLVTMRNIISRPLLPPRVKNPGYPIELEQVIVKCLQKDPEKRYQTMQELGLALERALASMGHGDDDVGGFVRTLMGDRGAKRRAAIRDAVRAADERMATGTLPIAVATSSPVVHEAVSEIILTQMATGVMKEEMVADRATDAPTSAGTLTASPVPSSADRAAARAQSKNRSGMFIGIGIATAALFVSGALFYRGNRSAAAPPPPNALAASNALARSAANAASPDPPASVAMATPPAVAPSPTASAATETTPAPTSSVAALNIKDLPDATSAKPAVAGPLTAAATTAVKAPATASSAKKRVGFTGTTDLGF